MMSMELDKTNSQSLTESVVQLFLGKILSGEWKTGDRLSPEREIAGQLGVSRSSVHLAILELAEKGFLESIPRQGTLVCDYRKHPTPGTLQLLMSYGSVDLGKDLFADMMDTRLLLETESARLACSNIYESTFRDMQEILDTLSQPDADVTDLLYRFHYHLVQASGNSIYSMIFRGFEPVLRSLISLHYSDSADLPESIRRHQALLDAISEKDEALASRLAREIITQGITAIRPNYSWTASEKQPAE